MLKRGKKQIQGVECHQPQLRAKYSAKKVIVVNYQLTPAYLQENECSLERAFDVLFESILKNNKQTKNNYGK